MLHGNNQDRRRPAQIGLPPVRRLTRLTERTTMVAAPLSDVELIGRADLVVEGRVLSRYGGRAAVQLGRVTKGKPRLHRRGWLCWLGFRRAVVVGYRSQPREPMLGDWWNEDAFCPGNRIRAHLKWDDDAKCYRSVWWNGIEILH